jgi:hypothetical protein
MFTGVLPALHPWVTRANGRARFSSRTVTSTIRETLCGLSGHAFLRHTEPGRIFLQCADCGRETPGWRIDTATVIRARR